MIRNKNIRENKRNPLDNLNTSVVNSHDLYEMKLPELKMLAKNMNLVGYSKMAKRELTEFINEQDSSSHHQRKSPLHHQRDSLHHQRKSPSHHQREASPSLRKSPSPSRKSPSPSRKDSSNQIQKEFTDEFLDLRSEQECKYVKIKQLGKEGKEGIVYLVMNPSNGKKYAMKTFRSRKSGRTLEKEAFFQYLASKKDISPKIYEYNPEYKYIVMDILDQTLVDILRAQNGSLTSDQQKQILNLYSKLDDVGIMINDANPLNIMEKRGKLYAIDYGFAKFTDHKDFANYPRPNSQLMPIGLITWLKESSKTWRIIRNSIDPEMREKMGIIVY